MDFNFLDISQENDLYSKNSLLSQSNQRWTLAMIQAWKDVKQKTLRNCWNKLLKDKKSPDDFQPTNHFQFTDST